MDYEVEAMYGRMADKAELNVKSTSRVEYHRLTSKEFETMSAIGRGWILSSELATKLGILQHTALTRLQQLEAYGYLQSANAGVKGKAHSTFKWRKIK